MKFALACLASLPLVLPCAALRCAAVVSVAVVRYNEDALYTSSLVRYTFFCCWIFPGFPLYSVDFLQRGPHVFINPEFAPCAPPHKKKYLPFALPGRMTFAHTMDSSWRRRHASSCSSKRKVPFIRADSLSRATPLSHDDHHDYYSTKGGCTPFARAPPPLAALPLPIAAGDAVSSYSSAINQQRNPWKGSFPLHHVSDLSLERVGSSGSGTAAAGAYDGVFPAHGDVGSITTLSSSSSRGMGEEGGGKTFDWREGLGQVARVLALSISSPQK